MYRVIDGVMLCGATEHDFNSTAEITCVSMRSCIFRAAGVTVRNKAVYSLLDTRCHMNGPEHNRRNLGKAAL